MQLFQKRIKVNSKGRGFHLITKEIESQLPELSDIKNGLAHIFIQHTSASLTINENADPTVLSDFETFFNKLVPENQQLFSHISEGPDDMTSHIKTSLLGNSVIVPITKGHFNLGTWQGIYLCEHRNLGHTRNIIVTVIGL